MAIDVKTLRIGSHILVNGKRVRVFGIGNNAIFYLPSIVSSVCKETEIEQIEPIAITPELLKELGLKYRTPICIWIKASEDEYLSFERICGTNRYRVHLYSGDIDRGKCVCRYLHEAEAFLALHDVELIQD